MSQDDTQDVDQHIESEEQEPDPEYTFPDRQAVYFRKRQEAKEAGEYFQGEIILEDEILNGELHKLALFSDRVAVWITAYNPTEPIEINGEKVIFARVEPTGDGDPESIAESQCQSIICVFKERPEGGWELIDTPTLRLQDPFYCGQIEGKHIFGGVETKQSADGKKITDYHTAFYAFDNNLSEAQKIMEGPDRMKGIRIIQRASKQNPDKTEISALYRSQGEIGGRGKMGHFTAENLEEVNEIFREMEKTQTSTDESGQSITKLKNPALAANSLIELCSSEEWVGGNEIHVLSDGNLGILAHLGYDYPDPAGRMNPENPSISLYIKRYVATAFIIDPDTNEIVQPMEVICTADDFPSVKPKKKDLDKIFYPGGLVRNGDGTAMIYGGIGDLKAGRRPIKDPFWDYEQNLKKT